MDMKLEEFAAEFSDVTLECRPVTSERPKRWRMRLEGARDGFADIEGWGDTPTTAVYDAAYKLEMNKPARPQ